MAEMTGSGKVAFAILGCITLIGCTCIGLVILWSCFFCAQKLAQKLADKLPPKSDSNLVARELAQTSEDSEEDWEDDWEDEVKKCPDRTCACLCQPKGSIGCGSCCCILLVVAYFVAMLIVGRKIVSRLSAPDTYHDPAVTPPNFPRYMGCGSSCSPGEKTDAEIAECMAPCSSLAFVKSWEQFATEHPWQMVSFPSRPGPDGQPAVNITAWWLPADTSHLPRGHMPPRIIVQHGASSNMNHCGVQATCYLLRTMGFSCLTPSVRDYGLSGKSAHPDWVSWGFDYENDILGAWDYAVMDPDGKLGGAVETSQVGIMGFSRGGLDVANAFALEPKVPAAWVDSAPWTGLYGQVDANIRAYAGFFTPVVREPAYFFANMATGWKLDKHIPLQMLYKCHGPQRKLAIVQGMEDGTVSTNEGMTAVQFLAGLSDCYDTTVYIPPKAGCGDGHHTYMLVLEHDAVEQWCRFWSSAFNQDPGLCGLDVLPSFQSVNASSQAPDNLPRFVV